MPSRALKLIAVLCACAGLSAGLAACGGNDEETGTVALTELPNNPQSGSNPGSPATGGMSGGSADAAGGDTADAAGGAGDASGGDDAAASDDASGDDAAGADSGGGAADAGSAGGDVAEGKAIFTQSCAGCHTLADAGSTGSVGPNLDDLGPDEATVAAKVRAGGGGMPSFDGTLAPEQIQAVAAYVSGAAGS